MRVGLVKRSPELSFSAFSLPCARGGPEPGSRWSARSEARTNDLVRRRGRPQSVFREKALGQRSWSRKHPFGPPVAGRVRMTIKSGPSCSLSGSAVFQAMSRLEHTRSEAFSDNGTASLDLCRFQRLEDVEGPCQQLAGQRHAGDVLAPPLGHGLEDRIERRESSGVVAGLGQDPADGSRAGLGDVAVADLAIGVANAWREAGPGAQLAGRGEPVDVADLSHERHGRQHAHPRQDAEGLDPRIGLGQLSDVALQALDRYIYRVEHAAAVVDDLAMHSP